MSRGRLRVYLGAAPGVGKTYAMLGEGHRRHERGTDVVVGFVECHGRPRTVELCAGLETVPRTTMEYRGATFTELDTDAVIARAPQVALIDELAHTNVPGSRHEKRWQDIEDILAAGIDVITTVNVQHLDSLNDVVAQITGVPQRETVPDAVVRRADQVELVDMAPEALRRRMAHGNVYAAERVDAALANYFRVGNLTALRELALLWLADKVDDQLDRYRADHRIDATWEARERVVVALTGGPEGDTLIRRAVRIADRAKGSDLFAVHVTVDDGLTGASPANLARQRALVERLGGTYHQVVGDDIPQALLDFARGVNATQLVLGASRRGRFAQILSRGVGTTTTALSGAIDVHMVTHEEVSQGRRRPVRAGGLTKVRKLTGLGIAVFGLPLLTLLLANLRGQLSLASEILLFLVAVVGVALAGGLYPALFAAVAGSLLLNYYFTPPIYEFTVGEWENVLALAAFVLVGVAVSVVVDLAARRTREAARASADAEMVANLAGGVLRGESTPRDLLDRLRVAFGLESATLLERRPDAPMTPGRQADPGCWRIVAAVGGEPCRSPDEGAAEVPIDDDLSLVLRGRTPSAADQRVLEAFAAQAALALRQHRLTEEAQQARPLAAADRMRTALLAAVSHDLRSPLSSAKAAVESLRTGEVDWTEGERDELLATADESLERLARLVANLLDMSRLQAGLIGVSARPVAAEEIVPKAVDDLGPDGVRVRVRIPFGLPDAVADPALLERVLVNLVSNAVRYGGAGEPVVVTASAHADRVELRVIDRGPGIAPADRDRVFLPFQRLGDHDNDTGVGLGLALSRGLVEAMGGTLEPDDTPGGGLTMIVTLPASPPDRGGPPLTSAAAAVRAGPHHPATDHHMATDDHGAPDHGAPDHGAPDDRPAADHRPRP
jgi:two-component system, OmpR family, sensor histidine kinase KdpD